MIFNAVFLRQKTSFSIRRVFHSCFNFIQTWLNLARQRKLREQVVTVLAIRSNKNYMLTAHPSCINSVIWNEMIMNKQDHFGLINLRPQTKGGLNRTHNIILRLIHILKWGFNFSFNLPNIIIFPPDVNVCLIRRQFDFTRICCKRDPS